ncbi:hypothetical protein vseg_003758 [Gypsophila vaccaria]
MLWRFGLEYICDRTLKILKWLVARKSISRSKEPHDSNLTNHEIGWRLVSHLETTHQGAKSHFFVGKLNTI